MNYTKIKIRGSVTTRKGRDNKREDSGDRAENFVWRVGSKRRLLVASVSSMRGRNGNFSPVVSSPASPGSNTVNGLSIKVSD